MSFTTEEKIDNMAVDVAETRGMLKEVLPALKIIAAEHDKRINDLEKKQASLGGKIFILSAGVGAVMTGIATWIGNHLHLNI